MKAKVKTIGTNGQISLGKKHAGKQLLVVEREPGVWFIHVAKVTPCRHSERSR